jgi:thiol:disulfide interchange protein DsbD
VRERARSARDLAWEGSYERAVALAKAEGRPVIIDFWAEWCTACKELDRTAWSDPRVRAEASRFVALKVDGTDAGDAFQAVADRFGVLGMPTVVFVDGKGREVPERVTGAIDAGEMLQRLRAVDGACDAPARKAAAPPPAALACVARW